MTIVTICRKLPEPLQVPVFRVVLVLTFPITFTLSSVGAAANQAIFIEAPEIMER